MFYFNNMKQEIEIVLTLEVDATLSKEKIKTEVEDLFDYHNLYVKVKSIKDILNQFSEKDILKHLNKIENE